jgi:arylsulfatase A
MNRRHFLKTLGASALAMPALPAGRRPNFVFLLMDDLGWADLGYSGSDFYETPHIDRLAAQGMRFDHGYAAAPVCSPTRAGIMSGKWPARVGVTNFIPGRSPRKHARLLPPEFNQQLALEEVSMAEALKAGGYATGYVGKWHLGGGGYSPERQGFDFTYATAGPHMAGTWRVAPPHKPSEGEHQWEALTTQSERFIEANRERPFFLYLSHHIPHIPLESTAELIAKYQAKLRTPKFRARAEERGPAQNNPVYAAMLEAMDDSVGRLMRKLEETGAASNTVVIFTSDNGGLSAPEFENRPTTSNAPLREGKGHIYEGGIRAPLLVRWPDAVKAGSASEVPVSSVDFYPTMLDAAGVRGEASHRLDGESIVPLLGGRGRLRRDALYWHYPHYSNQGGDPAGAVRQGDWKLVELYEGNRLELYNLRKDPGERDNLAGSMPARARRMRDMLHAWRKDVNAQMPTPNPDYDPARQRQGLRWVPAT